MPAANKTGNDSNARTAVVNQAQHVRGSRISDIPGARMFNIVVMKFRAPKSDATQNKAMLVIHKITPSPCPGPALSPSALSGAYPVQPPIGPMTLIMFGSSTKKLVQNASINTTSATKVIQNDNMFST